MSTSARTHLASANTIGGIDVRGLSLHERFIVACLTMVDPKKYDGLSTFGCLVGQLGDHVSPDAPSAWSGAQSRAVNVAHEFDLPIEEVDAVYGAVTLPGETRDYSMGITIAAEVLGVSQRKLRDLVKRTGRRVRVIRRSDLPFGVGRYGGRQP